MWMKELSFQILFKHMAAQQSKLIKMQRLAFIL